MVSRRGKPRHASAIAWRSALTRCLEFGLWGPFLVDEKHKRSLTIHESPPPLDYLPRDWGIREPLHHEFIISFGRESDFCNDIKLGRVVDSEPLGSIGQIMANVVAGIVAG